MVNTNKVTRYRIKKTEVLRLIASTVQDELGDTITPTDIVVDDTDTSFFIITL